MNACVCDVCVCVYVMCVRVCACDISMCVGVVLVGTAWLLDNLDSRTPLAARLSCDQCDIFCFLSQLPLVLVCLPLDLLMSTYGCQECSGRDVKIREHRGRMGPTFCDVTQVSAHLKRRSAASATLFFSTSLEQRCGIN